MTALTSWGLPFGPEVFDYQYSLSVEYKLERSSAYVISILQISSGQNGTKTIVPKTVTGIAWNSDFILASREDRESGGAGESPDYWVIDVKSGEIYGPLTEEESGEK